MASVNLNTAFFSAMQDADGNAPVVGLDPVPTLQQRHTAPPALPTLSGTSLPSNGFFYNDQDALSGLHSATVGSPGFGAKGMTLPPDVYLTHNTFGTSTALRGTWWADGILSIEGPLDPSSERYLTRHQHHGGLLIDYVNNQWRFVLENVGHDATSRVTFTNITVPISNAAADSVPKPFYLRLVREIPSTGTGEVHLVVNDGTTVQTQTLTGIAKPTTFATAVHDLGFGSTGRLNFYWFRETSTETAATVGTLQGTYWSSPVIFETVSYFSHGSSSVGDAGTDDQYWHNLGINQPAVGNALLMNGGARVKVRAAATNTSPTGSTSSLFSGSYITMQNITSVLPDPQGRYLALELRFEPTTDWPLSMSSAHIRTDTTDIMVAQHFPTAQGTNTVTLPVAGEGDSGGTLPYQVEAPITTEVNYRVSRMDTEFPYTVARPLGTAPRRSFQVSWLLTESEKDTLESFFHARDGGEQAFTWTPPGDSASSKAALLGELTVTKLAPDVFRVRAEILEVL